jgi:hypothetical protein
MTTKLAVAAKLAVLTLLLLPCTAQAQARAKVRPAAAKRPALLRRSQPAHAAVYRICAAKRVLDQATPEIEPEWPAKVELVAKR